MELAHRIAKLLKQGAVVELVPGRGSAAVVKAAAVVVAAGKLLYLPVRLSREILSGGAEIVADAELAQGFLGGFVEHLQKFRVHPVVAVHKGNPPADTVCENPVNAGIPGGRQAAVFLMNHMNPAVPKGVTVAKNAAVIRGAVVHQNQLEIPVGLSQDTLHTAAQEGLHLVNRHDHTDVRHGYLPFSRALSFA